MKIPVDVDISSGLGDEDELSLIFINNCHTIDEVDSRVIFIVPVTFMNSEVRHNKQFNYFVIENLSPGTGITRNKNIIIKAIIEITAITIQLNNIHPAIIV